MKSDGLPAISKYFPRTHSNPMVISCIQGVRPDASPLYHQDRDFCIFVDYTIGHTAEERGC